MGLERARIQNAIIAAALVGSFYAIERNKDTKLITYGEDPGSFDAGHTAVGPYGVPVAFITPPPANSLKRITPASASCNETHAAFGPSNNTRSLSQDRKSWAFELLLHFNEEVTVEQFEQDWMVNPVKLDHDPDNGLRCVTIKILNSTYTHPPQQQPNQGSRVTIRFEAQLSPA